MRAAAIFAMALLFASNARATEVPAGYPADYAKLIAAAERERDLVIYGAIDAAAVQPLLKAFAKEFPHIAVDYKDLSASELNALVISDTAMGDIAWSGAMDSQLKLARDGYAARYASPEKPNLPQTLQYRDLAYGVTYEPVVFVHNKRLLPDAPQTHDAFLQLLHDRKSALTGKVATYDIEHFPPSFSFAGNDQRQFARFDELAAALNEVGAKRYVATGTLLERIGNGQQLLGYNVAGSAAITRAGRDKDLGVIYPQDYTELASTVMLITARARHPNAAKLFLDFVLRREGQAALTEANLFAVRDDVGGRATVRALTAALGDRLKPIALDDSAVQLLEPARRLALLQAWQGKSMARETEER